MAERIITTEDAGGRSRLESRNELAADNSIPIAAVWNLWRVAPDESIPGPVTPPGPLPDIGHIAPGEVLVFKFTFPAHTEVTEARGVIDFTDQRPGFHSTDSIDVQTLLEGELILLLDEEETTIRTGDSVVLRGQSHAWENRSDSPATLLVTLVGARREGAV